VKLAEPAALDLNRQDIADALAAVPLASGDPAQARIILWRLGI